jgi:hypothetical protein
MTDLLAMQSHPPAFLLIQLPLQHSYHLLQMRITPMLLDEIDQVLVVRPFKPLQRALHEHMGRRKAAFNLLMGIFLCLYGSLWWAVQPLQISV